MSKRPKGRPQKVYLVKNMNTGGYVKAVTLHNLMVWTDKKEAIRVIKKQFQRGASEYKIETYRLVPENEEHES